MIGEKIKAYGIPLATAAAGAIISWYLTKKKYEKIVEEEVESIRKVALKNMQDKDEEDKEIKKDPEPKKVTIDKPSIMEYAAKIRENRYGTEFVKETTKNFKEPDESKIFVIPPELFGELEDYETLSFTYYKDGILTDDNDEIIDDPGEVVGETFADHFGEYEDDSVFIRNCIRECDYEILKDERTYKEVARTKPRPVEVS